VPGRHHHEPRPGPIAPAPTRRRLTLTLASVAIVVGGTMIAGWATLTGDGRDDPRTITVRPSAALPAPTATLDGLVAGDLFPSATPSAPPTATPSAPPTAAPPSAPVSGTPTLSSPVTGSAPRPAASASPTTRVSGTATTSASPVLAPSSTPPDELTASYALTSTSADGFAASITVRNPTPAAQTWTVVLTYPPGTPITVTGYWNATPRATGRRLSFNGGPLTAGASYTFGFRAESQKSGGVNATACTINGIACAGF
jgi:hypothetical protein